MADEINEYDTYYNSNKPHDKNIVIFSQKEYDSWQETSDFITIPEMNT